MHNVYPRKDKVNILYTDKSREYYKNLNDLVLKVNKLTLKKQGIRVFTDKGVEYTLDFILSFYPTVYHHGCYYYWNSGRKPSCYRLYRSPRTTQERRWHNDYDDAVYPFTVKYRRRALPTTWDDILCSDYGVKNWKHFRRHQWKIVDNRQENIVEVVINSSLNKSELQHQAIHSRIYREGS